MNKQILSLFFGIFLLTTVSAIYGGETYSIEIEFEPMACSVTDNLSHNIIGNNVNIDLPINFLGNFTLTCFSGEETSPVIVYRGGGSRTRYVDRNVTEYVDKIVEVEKIVEIEVPGENTIIEKKLSSRELFFMIILPIIFGIIIGLIIIKIIKYYIVEKGGKNKNE